MFIELRKMLLLYFISVVFMTKISAEEYNLFGDPGQAYALQAYVGHPHQKVNVIIDTGSTTLAIASYPREENKIYFNAENSTSIFNSGREVKAQYSLGMWWGQLASDYVSFPSLKSIEEVRSDMVLITKSNNFFMNGTGTGWQGLLGLAYLPVGAWIDNDVVESWLDALDRTTNKPMSFQMKLCGVISNNNATHYGQFKMIDNEAQNKNHNKTFKTPILRKRWYEVGVISIRVISKTNDSTTVLKEINRDPDEETCQKLNAEKSIVDSGTTNIRLPEVFFRQVVDQLKNVVQSSNILILDDFWYHGEAACWPEPQEWSLPWLAIDLLNEEADNQYFTLEIPSQNYMQIVKAHNSTGEDGVVSEYCYQLALEGSSKDTVIGYTVMEGFEVTFNRASGWIGWQTSNCGTHTRISGPYNTTTSLKTLCQLVRSTHPTHQVATSIKAAQWTLFALSIIASAVLIYLLAPCVKVVLFHQRLRPLQISLSQAALVEQESN